MTKIDQKWPKSPKIWFQWAHMMKLIVNYVWNKFGKILELFDHFLAIFFFSLKTHDFSEFFFENSKKALFDLWDLLWWVFHMFLALNHWFRPKNEGWKKSVPKMFKTAVTVVLKKTKTSYRPHCQYSKAYKRHTKGKSFVTFISKICLLNLQENAF